MRPCGELRAWAAPPGGVTRPPVFISKFLGTYKTIALITENAQHNSVNNKIIETEMRTTKTKKCHKKNNILLYTNQAWPESQRWLSEKARPLDVSVPRLMSTQGTKGCGAAADQKSTHITACTPPYTSSSSMHPSLLIDCETFAWIRCRGEDPLVPCTLPKACMGRLDIQDYKKIYDALEPAKT